MVIAAQATADRAADEAFIDLCMLTEMGIVGEDTHVMSTMRFRPGTLTRSDRVLGKYFTLSARLSARASVGAVHQVTQSRVHASHEATLPHPAAAVWRYFHWPNLALMQPGGFFADIAYGDQRPVSGATRTILLGGGHGDGTPLREILESSDTAAMCLRYRIVDPAPMPVEGYRGEVKVQPIDDSNCIVEVLLRVHSEGHGRRDLARNVQGHAAGQHRVHRARARRPIELQSSAASRANNAFIAFTRAT